VSIKDVESRSKSAFPAPTFGSATEYAD